MSVVKGFKSLGLLLFGIAVTVALVALARGLTVGQGFLVEQRVVVIVWLAGQLVSGAFYTVSTMRVLRGATSPQTVWGLGISALILVLAVALALAIPQHPTG